MNKREYLRSIGFNVGERGRLTPAMLTALKDFKGETKVATPMTIEYVQPYVDYVGDLGQPLRQPRTLYGRDREGNLLGFTTCAACDKHMSYCSCPNGIQAPSKVIMSKEKEVYVNR